MAQSFLTLFLAAVLAGELSAQSSAYYIVDGRIGLISVLQNGAVIRSWTERDDCEPVLVRSGIVRTYAEFNETGSEYDLRGNWTGVDYPDQGKIRGVKSDGATDGAGTAWIAAYYDDAVWQCNDDWSGQARLFRVQKPTGITYDQNRGHLWVIEYTRGEVVEYDLAGVECSAFAYKTKTGWLGCLAWEPATDHLWALESQYGDVFEFDKAGNVLQTFNVPALAAYAVGGEFELNPTLARWRNYGQGFPGTLGIPGIVASNPPKLGGPLTVTVDNSEGHGRIGAFLLIGLAPLSLPGNWGGTLLVSPLIFLPVGIPVSGLVLTTTLPNDPALDGVSAYLQALEFDPGAAKGISNTPGLQLLFGL